MATFTTRHITSPAAYALMNDAEQAVKWLTVAAEDGFPCYPLFAADANLDNLRGNEKFEGLMTKLRGQWEHFQSIL